MKCLIGKAKDIVFLYGDWDKNVIKWAKPTPVHHKSVVLKVFRQNTPR